MSNDYLTLTVTQLYQATLTFLALCEIEWVIEF